MVVNVPMRMLYMSGDLLFHITRIVKIEDLYLENLKSTLLGCVWYIGMRNENKESLSISIYQGIESII